MKYIVALLILLPVAVAHPIITAIHYDPPGRDTGFEWLELYNPTNETVHLNHTIQKGNGNGENQWSNMVHLTDSIPPFTYYLIGESEIDADKITTLVMQNTRGSIRILYNNTILETIGWGKDHLYSEYYQGEPTLNLGDIPIVRINTRGNNSQDFVPQHHKPRHSFYREPSIPTEQNITIIIPIEQPHDIITNITIHNPDTSPRLGHQIILLQDEELRITVHGSTHNTYELVHNETIVLSGQLHATIPLQSWFAPGKYELKVTPDGATQPFIKVFEIEPTIGFTTQNQHIHAQVYNQTHLHAQVMIHNIANTPFRPRFTLTTDKPFFTRILFQTEHTTHSSYTVTELVYPNSIEPVTVFIEKPSHIPSGNYTAQLFIEALAQ